MVHPKKEKLQQNQVAKYPIDVTDTVTMNKRSEMWSQKPTANHTTGRAMNQSKY